MKDLHMNFEDRLKAQGEGGRITAEALSEIMNEPEVKQLMEDMPMEIFKDVLKAGLILGFHLGGNYMRKRR